MNRKNLSILCCLALGSALLAMGSAGCSKSKTSGKSFEQFKRELSEIALERGVVTRKALLDKMGDPEKIQAIGSDIYLYYPVVGGTVQIISDQQCWESGVPGGLRTDSGLVTEPVVFIENINMY